MRKEEYSIGRLHVNEIIGGGISDPTPGIKRYLDPTNGSDGSDGREKTPLKSFAAGYAAMTTGKNDVLYIYPGTSGISLAADPVISKNLCSFIGTGNGVMNQRSRIGMSTTFSPMITVSGYGNTFANLYTMHGTATTDLVGISITGNRNSFYNMHFGGPMFATQGDQAGYMGVSIAASETYFKNCVFGTNTIARTGAYPTVNIAPNPTDHFGYTRFDDCTFLAMAGGANPVHVNVDNSSTALDETFVEFNRCRFIVTSVNMATAFTYAISFTTTAALGDTAAVFLDPTCQFFNCGLTTVNSYGNLWIPTAAKTAAAVTSALVSTVE